MNLKPETNLKYWKAKQLEFICLYLSVSFVIKVELKIFSVMKAVTVYFYDVVSDKLKADPHNKDLVLINPYFTSVVTQSILRNSPELIRFCFNSFSMVFVRELSAITVFTKNDHSSSQTQILCSQATSQPNATVTLFLIFYQA